MEDYLSVNRANWDERALAHTASAAYALDRVVENPTFLSKVVALTGNGSATSKDSTQSTFSVTSGLTPSRWLVSGRA